MTTPAKLIGQHEPGTDGWNEARKYRLGGSEIAAVMGLSPWASHFSLWMEKHGDTPPQPDRPLLEWGRRIEPAIRGKFVENHPGDWQANPGMFHHRDRSWQIANPDALTDGELAEFKTALYADEWGPAGTDDIPIYYRCQVLWYMDALEVERAWVAVLIGGTDYREYLIERDADAIQDMRILREAGEAFIQSLMNNRPPDIDRHSATYEVQRTLHPNIEPGQVAVDVTLAGDYLAAVIAEDEAKLDKQFYAAQILAELGSLREAVDDVDGARFAYRTHRSRDGKPGTPYLAPDRTRVKQLTHPTRATITEKAS